MTDTIERVIAVENYIGGHWEAAASGGTFESRDPATGALVARASRQSFSKRPRTSGCFSRLAEYRYQE